MPQQEEDDFEPLWARILDLLYRRGLGGKEPGTDPMAYRDKTADTIVNELNEPADTVTDTIEYMKDIGLLEERESESEEESESESEEYFAYGLTQKGFDVAHERRLTKQEQETNDNLVFLTMILGFAAIVQATAAALQLDNPSNTVSLLLIILIITLAIAFYQTNVIDRLLSQVRSMTVRIRG